MPLTPAHPAVVLPLQRLGLPLSALVAGAVAPDVPVYLPVGVGYGTTHSWTGLPVAIAIGLVVLWVWSAVLRDAVVDLTPPLRRRVPARSRLDGRQWLLAPVAVAVGAATHVLWDSATHDWGFVVQDLALLREELGPLAMYGWLQVFSTVVGFVVVAAYGVHRLRRRPVQARTAAVGRAWLWLTPVPLAALAVGLVWLDYEAAVGGAVIALLSVAVLWHATRRGHG